MRSRGSVLVSARDLAAMVGLPDGTAPFREPSPRPEPDRTTTPTVDDSLTVVAARLSQLFK